MLVADTFEGLTTGASFGQTAAGFDPPFGHPVAVMCVIGAVHAHPAPRPAGSNHHLNRRST